MLKMTVGKPDLGLTFAGLEEEQAQAVTTAMRGATGTLKQELRQQVRGAGLGNRLANTWRGDTYPTSGAALNPAGYVYSNAPTIIDAFARGATIAPLGGKKYLWIPTRNVPKNGQRKPMSPFEVEVAYNQDLIIRRGKGGRFLAFVSAVRGLSKRGGVKRVTKGRIAQGRDAELVLMFVLTSSVRIPKKLDLDDAANHAADDFVERFNQAVR